MKKQEPTYLVKTAEVLLYRMYLPEVNCDQKSGANSFAHIQRTKIWCSALSVSVLGNWELFRVPKVSGPKQVEFSVRGKSATY